MEQGLWIPILATAVISLVVFIFNTIVTRKIDDCNDRIGELEKARKEDRDLLFSRLDLVKVNINENYVRKDMYQQAQEFHAKEVDSKFNNLVDSISKLDSDVKARFEDVKNLINEKFSGKTKN